MDGSYTFGGAQLLNLYSVDENLFYKGVDKSQVPPSRLSQSHGINSNPLVGAPGSGRVADAGKSEPPAFGTGSMDSQPPYLFHSGTSLLAMARKHNVRISTLMSFFY